MKSGEIEEILNKLPTKVQNAFEWKADYQWQAIKVDKNNISYCIDHTYLKSDTDEAATAKLCKEAKKYNFYGVCLPPMAAVEANKQLEGAGIKVISVANFPLGSQLLENQYQEIESLTKVCDEIDFVQPLPLVFRSDYEELYDYFFKLKEKVSSKVLKVIIETSELTKEQIVMSSACAVAAKIDFLKTSSGFSSEGATIENVKLLRQLASDQASVKASGGIRNYEDILNMIKAGANRIGCNVGPQILGEK